MALQETHVDDRQARGRPLGDVGTGDVESTHIKVDDNMKSTNMRVSGHKTRQRCKQRLSSLLLSLLAAFLLLAACPLAYAQTGVPTLKSERIHAVENSLTPYVPVADQRGWNIRERMRAYGVAGLSVAVVNNYQVDWAKGYGWADAKFQKPVTVETMFSAGSISKPVAAMAALKLVQDGTMQLDDPVNTYLKSWKIPDNDFTRKTPVTLRHLLSHTAGTTQHGLGGYTPDEPLPTLVQTLNGTSPAQSRPIIVNAVPGQEFRYSGGGTMVAQMAVMDVTGQRYTQFMEDTIFRKLGMANSTYEQPLPPKAQRNASWAFSNQPWYKGMPYVYPDAAAAGLYTTPTDLAQFIIELQNALRGEKNQVLDQAHATMTVTPVKKDIEPGFYRSDIGLGIFLLQRTDNRDAPAGVYFTHSGLNAGFTADFIGSLQGGNGVVVMINNDDAMGLIKEVVRSVAKTYKWKNYFPDGIKPISMTAEQLDRYVGRYKKDDDEVITFSREGNHLLQKGVNWKIGVTAYPVGENTFAFTDYTLRGRFTLDEHGKAKTFQTDWSAVMPKMKDGEFVPSELLKMGRIAEAVEGYRILEGVDENKLTMMAHNLIKGKPTNLTAGLAIAKLALELYPESAVVHHRLAEGYEALGDNSRAILHYQKVLELNADNLDVRNSLRKLGSLNKKINLNSP